MGRRRSSEDSKKAERLPTYEYMDVDSELLIHVMENREFFVSSVGWNETGQWKRLEDLDEILGFKSGHIRQSLKRRRMSYYTLDKIACYLGHHPSLFIRSEYLLPEDAEKAQSFV